MKFGQWKNKVYDWNLTTAQRSFFGFILYLHAADF